MAARPPTPTPTPTPICTDALDWPAFTIGEGDDVEDELEDAGEDVGVVVADPDPDPDVEEGPAVFAIGDTA